MIFFIHQNKSENSENVPHNLRFYIVLLDQQFKTQR